MAWDASRPVPWERLAREWVVYVGIMGVIFVLFLRDRPLLGIFAGLLASGPLYLALGYVLAKFGYQRKTLRELRSAASEPSPKPEDTGATRRAKPAPTRRTGGAANRPGGTRKRRR